MKKILCTLAIIIALVCVCTACNNAQSPTISISEDGYWVIDGEKTEVKAKGEKGDQGIQGEKGDKGDKGDSATATDENPLGLTFFLKDDGTYAVEIGQAKYLSQIEIPATYKGKAVTEVGSFSSEILKGITIPDSVTSIGNSAFSNCDALTSVTIPDSVTSIGDDAFSNCNNITTATMPTTAISAIPKNNLTTVVLTSGTSIGGSAFYYCFSLTSVTIPDSVTSIGSGAFSRCSSLTSVTIPDSVTSIGSGAFSRCSSLTSVTIGDSVTNIGDSAFAGCNSLTSVTIPDSVTSIGDSAFASCNSLTSIFVDNDNTAYQSIDGNLYSKDGNKLIAYAIGKTEKSFTIPDSVTSIGDSAFCGCDSLTSVTIGDSVTSIGEWAFSDCTSLTSVTIPDSVTSIGDWAFSDCTSLTSVTFVNPNGWECEYYNDATRVIAISASDLSNPATAAKYLKSRYYNYYWYRTEQE